MQAIKTAERLEKGYAVAFWCPAVEVNWFKSISMTYFGAEISCRLHNAISRCDLIGN